MGLFVVNQTVSTCGTGDNGSDRCCSEVLYPFVLDGETKLPHMFVDIDDRDTGMRLLAIGAVVKAVVEVPINRS